MTLADIKNHIFRRTKTNATSFPAADMVIGINNAYERVNTIIRRWVSNYDPTRYTTSDLSTGTEVPKFNSLFHELIPLWVEYQWAIDNQSANAGGILAEIQLKEEELKEHYSQRGYRIFTVTIASPGVFTLNNHRLQTNDRILFETTGALPTGLSAETWYYVVSTTNDTFQVSSTKNGTAINTSGSQSGTHYVSVEKQKGLYVSNDSNK